MGIHVSKESKKITSKRNLSGYWIYFRKRLKCQKRANRHYFGVLLSGWPDGFNQVIHTPAFLSSSSLEQSLVNFFNRKNLVTLSNAEELKSKILWFLAEKSGLKYFCDGISLYAVSTSSTESPEMPLIAFLRALLSTGMDVFSTPETTN